MKIKECIYKITNIINNKVYIGSSASGFLRRKNIHVCDLSKNKHHSKKLQNRWNKHGKENFKFEVIEYCESSKLLEKEQYWINFYDSYHKGYNATPIAGNCKGRPVSEETRLKIMKSLKGRKVIRTIEHNINNGKSRRKIVFQYNKVGDIINKFESAASAAKFFQVDPATISANCLGIQRSRNFIINYA